MGRVRCRRGIWAGAAVVLAALSFGPADAATKIRTKIVEYDAPGSTAREVLPNFSIGPDVNGRKVWALTTWRVSWTTWYRETPERCVVTAPTVDAAIEIKMPRLVDAAKMQPNLRSAFEELLKNLLAHERGHERLVRDAARRIDRGIRSILPQATCDQIVQKANALGEQILRALDQASRDYDLREEPRAMGDLRFPTD